MGLSVLTLVSSYRSDRLDSDLEKSLTALELTTAASSNIYAFLPSF